MEKGYIKSALRLVGIRLAFIIISVFFMIAFTWLISLKNGMLYYSLLVSIFYLRWVFNDAREHGGRDMRAKRVKTPLKGFLYGALSEVIGAVLLLSLFFGVPSYVYFIWNAPFAGFIQPNGGFIDVAVNVMFYVVLLFVPVVSGAGYICGIKNFYFTFKKAK